MPGLKSFKSYIKECNNYFNSLGVVNDIPNDYQDYDDKEFFVTNYNGKDDFDSTIYINFRWLDPKIKITFNTANDSMHLKMWSYLKEILDNHPKLNPKKFDIPNNTKFESNNGGLTEVHHLDFYCITYKNTPSHKFTINLNNEK